MSTKEHKKHAPSSVRVGVISVSTTRSIDTDKSGQWIVEHAKKEGHDVIVHKVVSDNENEIRVVVLDAIRRNFLDIVLLTGGTGVTSKDVTIEALTPLFFKKISGFAFLFAQLSYNDIGSAAMLSRASAGVIGRTAVFCMPGSKKACKLACRALIFSEIGHIISHIK